MRSSYTNTKRKGGKPTKLQKRFKLTIYLAAIGLTLAAIATIVSFIQAGDDATTEVELPYGSLIELTKSETFMAAYLSVNCNPTLLESAQSIRVSGHMVNGDNRQAFTLTKKRPDRVLFTIDSGSHKMTFGVSGDTVWRRIRVPQHEDLFALIEGDEADAWLRQRRFFDRIISASQGGGELTAIEATTWKDADCLKVSTRDTDGAVVDILVDPQTMYPIAQLEPQKDGSIKQTEFSDYQDINGMPISFNMASSVEGEPQSSTILKSASLNPGVLSTLFDVPESLIADE